MSSKSTVFGVLAAIAAVFAGAACETVDPNVGCREFLRGVCTDIQSGDRDGGCAKLESFAAGTTRLENEYGVQRFFALSTLTRVHMQAAARDAYLREPGVERGQFGVSVAQTSTRPSSTAHLVAANFYIRLAQSLAARLQRPALTAGGVELLPDPEFTVEKALKEVSLYRLIVLARLGFAAEFDLEVDSIPSLKRYDECKSLVDAAGLDPVHAAWLYLAMFRHLAAGDEIAAFRFNVGARLIDKEQADALTEAESKELVTWLDSGTQYQFYCATCNTQQPSSVLACGTAECNGNSALNFDHRLRSAR
jgi:hypothetical protein